MSSEILIFQSRNIEKECDDFVIPLNSTALVSKLSRLTPIFKDVASQVESVTYSKVRFFSVFELISAHGSLLEQ
jgi:hypothetical protein